MRTFVSTLILAASAGLAAAPAAQASDLYGGVMGSFVVPDGKRSVENGFGGAVFLGYPLWDGVSGELNAFAHKSSFDVGSGDLKVLGGSFDLNAGLGSMGEAHPFVLLGIGAEQDKYPSGGKDRSPLLDLGAGFVWKALRAELRWYGLNQVDAVPNRDLVQDFRFNVGLQFGGAATAVAAPEPVAAPAPVAAPEPAAPAAPVDSDGDGIVDSVDKCPGTPAGTDVDATGCVDISKVVLKGVNFGSNSAVLLPAAASQLQQVADAMKANPQLKVEVNGYTDSTGDAKKNEALSEARAKSVKDFLVKQGVDAGRLTTKGHGSADPVDTNKTKEGRANNRRVSFKVL